jgi:hypothetical protein
MAFADPAKGRSVMVSPGSMAAVVTVAEAVKEGDILGYSSGWKRALATVGTAIQGRLVALKDTPNGGQCPVATHCVVTNYTGATPGGYIYVAEGTSNGQVTQTAPSTTGDCNVIIGVALSATDVQFFLNSRADSVA